MSDADVAELPLCDGLAPVAAAIADLLVATFGGEAAAPNPPQLQDATGLRPSPGTTP